MTGAVENAEELLEGADALGVLDCQHTSELVKVGEIVDSPGGEELGERRWAQSWMLAPFLEVGGAEIPGAQLGHGCGACGGELIEQTGEGFGLGFGEVAGAFERREGLAVTVLQNVACAGYPVDVLGIEIVRDDVHGSPGVFTFVASCPSVGQIAKKSVENGRRAGEKGESVIEVEFHG